MPWSGPCWRICASIICGFSLFAVSARYPTRDELLDCRRTFELSGPFDATLWLLDTALEGALGSSAPRRDMVLLRDTVLVEVDHTAKHSLHTGVQQVVREVMPHWTHDHHVVPVAWTSNWGVHRALSRRELQRVVSWGRGDAAGPSDDGADSGAIVVPWQCVVVLAEVPFGNAPLRLSPLAQSSGNRVVAIGYDCIPVVSADLVSHLGLEPFRRVPQRDQARRTRWRASVNRRRRNSKVSSRRCRARA